jgi:hypothetical protein
MDLDSIEAAETRIYDWAKLYIRMLDDPNIGTLPDSVWRNYVELILLAVEHARHGLLPPLGQIVQRLPADTAQINESIAELERRGLLRSVYSDGVCYFYVPRIDRFCGKPIPTPLCSDWAVRRELVFERDNHRCRYCGAYATHVDHVIPRCQGGSHELDNLVASCAHCNRTKNGRMPEQAGMELING